MYLFSITNMNQSCNSLCYHPLQTEDELELVNEVIPPHVSHWHESMAIGCPHIISMVPILYERHCFGLAPLTFWDSACVSHLTACGSGLMVVFVPAL